MSLLINYQASFDDIKYEVFNSSAQNKVSFPPLILSQPTTLYRNRNTCHLLAEAKIPKDKKEQYEPFIVVKKINRDYLIANAHLSSDSIKEMLCLLTSNHQQSQKVIGLKEGKVLKLGMVKLQLQTIHLKNQRSKKGKTFYEQKFFSQIVPSNRIGVDFYEDSAYASTIDTAPTCRYCFSKSLDHSNQFLSLCKCEGSSKYVHMKCLSAWVVQRSHYCETKAGIYCAQTKGLLCEICKQMFPIQQILPCFLRPEMKEYTIICINTQKNENVYIIRLEQSCQISVGRKSECHIVIEDPSISRNHCTLLWDSEKGVISVRDENSKFGTLVKKSSLIINKEWVLQRGRVRMNLSPISKKSAFSKIFKGLFNFQK